MAGKICEDGCTCGRHSNRGRPRQFTVIEAEQRLIEQSKHYIQRWVLRTKYGMTPEQLLELLKSQGGKCANSGCRVELQLESSKRRGIDGLAIDHDHETLRVRGLLCGGCNRALGLVRENPERLLGLVQYLQNSC